ncbi:MAG: peptidylprolyl isomerase [Ignavibacteriales bacterium]|nr:peptidylprolyl isomerase [Ignavibacteriales bacterium]
MRSIQILTFLLISFVGMSNLFSQSSSEIVAKAGDVTITKKEYKKRYEFVPHVRTDNAFDSTSFKKNFLHTLIAEKLLAQAATIEGIDRLQNFRATMENLTNVYLRDALYKKEVLDKITLPDSAIIKGRIRMRRSVRTKFIFSQDKKEIEKIYSEIGLGASFDSILTTRPEKLEQKEAAEVTFGTMNEKMENAIYKIDVGQITSPIELREGWYICKIYSITTKMELDESDKSKIEKVIKSRSEDKIYQAFHKQFFKGIVINADRPKVEKLYNVIMSYLNENKMRIVKDKGGKYKIGEIDIPQIKNSFDSKELNEIIIKFPKDPITLSKMFDYLAFQDFEFYSIDSAQIKNRLNSYISSYIQNEMLAREAKKRGYDKLPEVASELKMWREYYLAHEMMKKVYKDISVTDDEAYNFFVKANQVILQPDEFNIAEINTNDLSTIETVLNELDMGIDFKFLAKKYASNDSLKAQEGISGFFKESEKGEIGKAVSRMKIGEIYGPIKSPEGYSLIKLLEKREGKKEKVATFEEAKEDVKNILKTEKMYQNLDETTAKLAASYGVKINDAALNSIKVSSINMIVLRRFGFGGQLLAVPFTPNFSSWFKKFEQLKKKNIL